MSRVIHINLLKKSERRSCLPVRSRVMIPVFAGLLLLGVWVASGLLHDRIRKLDAGLADIAEKRDGLQSSHAEYQALKAREQAAMEELGQLEAVFHARLACGPALSALPHAVPSTMQLTSLNLTPPVRPKEDTPARGSGRKKTTQAAVAERAEKTAPTERVTLRLGGLVDSAASVDRLKDRLLSGSFTNWMAGVEIPPGSFKIADSESGQYGFDLNATFKERVFQ